ncbi:MAG: hypothetical protein WAT39_00610, partial [Planctomycetota bacterium]
GEDTLVAEGPAAARPWFAMAIGALDAPTSLQRAITGYCDAAADNDTARMAAIAAVVRRLGPPERLQAVFAD